MSLQSILSARKVESRFLKRLVSGIIAIVFVGGILTACDKRKTAEKNEKLYYDLQGFIENQLVHLKEQKPKMIKTAELDAEKQVISTSDIDWEKELGLFMQADINKPSYAQSYNVIRSDSATYEYRLKDNADLPVQYLKITTDTVLHAPLKVQALIKSKNRIYESEKNVELNCTKQDNLLQISSYSVQGYQKLIFMEPRSFHISSKIVQ